MNKQPILLAGLIPLLAACNDSPSHDIISGYVEGEAVYIAPSIAGRLEQLEVKRGDTVNAGVALFSLEAVPQQAAVDEAIARLNTARAQAANLETGKRPSEIAALEASLASAKATRKAAVAEYARQKKIISEGYLPAANLDSVKAQRDSAAARVRELEAQLVTAQLAGREQERVAAQSSVKAGEAALQQAQWQLQQTSVNAPKTGLVEDTYYLQGEWVPAGRPVLSLLPPENRKVRFFIPEARMGALSAGQQLSARCDGCGEPIPLTIEYIAPQAEYTPPVIYSNDSRQKLVVMLEAAPSPQDALRLKVGQPVDITLP